MNKVIAVLSAPRIVFAENIFCTSFFPKMDIELIQPRSAFWERGMTLGFQMALDKGADIILALDYDTVFGPEDVKMLLDLMESNPEADVIFGAQIKRETNELMGAVHSDEQIPLPQTDYERSLDKKCTVDFQKPLTRFFTAHFGLTAIRASSLKKLPTPWFWTIPSLGCKNQSGEVLADYVTGNCIDADIQFWLIAEQAQWKVYQANEVLLGHLQRVITWPKADMSGLDHQYASDWNNLKMKPSEINPPDIAQWEEDNKCYHCFHACNDHALSEDGSTVKCACGCDKYLAMWERKLEVEEMKENAAKIMEKTV